MSLRNFQFYVEDHSVDPRTIGKHDRDRVLHSNALRRLAGVSQVINPQQGQIFHNRLTHTLKVAQIGRRLAEKLLNDAQGSSELNTLINKLGGIDADIVETAALAHDLGHPPFGHTGEEILDRLVRQYNQDGFEGNAQSFRIVTKLSARRHDQSGLNLSLASLQAMQKYPWYWNEKGAPFQISQKKWGAYRTESRELEKIREAQSGLKKYQISLEAAIMDLADDIAYATHDVEDFYRAGLIPLHHLWSKGKAKETREAEIFISKVIKNRKFCDSEQQNHALVNEVFNRLTAYFSETISEVYRGNEDQKAILREIFDIIIDSYIKNITINPDALESTENLLIFPSEADSDLAHYLEGCENISIPNVEIKMFKDLTRYYVHDFHALRTQQYGEQHIISELFNIYFQAYLSDTDLGVLPNDYKLMRDNYMKEEEAIFVSLIPQKRDKRQKVTSLQALCARLAADYITRMTDEEAVRIYHRLSGINLGALHDNML